MTVLFTTALVVLLAFACWFDLRERRIPNLLTIAGLLTALGLRLVIGVDAATQGAEGALFAVLVGLAPFTFGLMGGGDVKLLGAVGAFVGVNRLFGALLMVGVVGGLLALVEATRQRAMLRALRNVAGFARQWLQFGRPVAVATIESPEAMTVPYGVAIALGSLLWWFVGGSSL